MVRASSTFRIKRTFELWWLDTLLDAMEEGVEGALLAILNFDGLFGCEGGGMVSAACGYSPIPTVCEVLVAVDGSGCGITKGIEEGEWYHVSCRLTTESQ